MQGNSAQDSNEGKSTKKLSLEIRPTCREHLDLAFICNATCIPVLSIYFRLSGEAKITKIGPQHLYATQLFCSLKPYLKYE